MRHYEIVFLVHPDKSSQVPSIVDGYKTAITQNKGKVDRFEDWGIRKLAYPIAKVSKAHYLLMNITCDLTTLQTIQSDFRYNDMIIRDLILSTPKPVTDPSPMMRQSTVNDEPIEEGEGEYEGDEAVLETASDDSPTAAEKEEESTDDSSSEPDHS